MTTDPKPVEPSLRRVLGLKELVLYGIVLIQPTAPMPIFGVAYEKAHGHVVTTVPLGMVAMLFTVKSRHLADLGPLLVLASAPRRSNHPGPGERSLEER